MQWMIPLLLLILPLQGVATETKHKINTGDPQLDSLLIKLNHHEKKNIKRFSRIISREYMLPLYRIDNMISNYHFTPADIFLTVELADISGQPVDIVSRAYMENKQQGWRFTLQQLNVLSSQKHLQQLRREAEIYTK